MAGFIPRRLYKGCHHLSVALETICTTPGEYYRVNGIWSDGTCNEGFVYDGTGKLTYLGQSNVKFLFNGVSDLSANKVCRVEYQLYINGNIVPGASTPTNFEHANSLSDIAITNFVILNTGDYIEVYIKSDTTTTTVTHETLFLTFLGEI